MCELSEKVQCTHCFRCSASGNIYCRFATSFPKEQGRSGDIGTNTQAESRTTRSINISQVSLLKGQRGNRRGSTAEQEASCFFIHSLMPFTVGLMDSAGTSKIRSEVSVYWVTVSRDDPDFTKKRPSSKTAELYTHLEHSSWAHRVFETLCSVSLESEVSHFFERSLGELGPRN